MKFDYKKLFAQKKLSELTDEQITKWLKERKRINLVVSCLFVVVLLLCGVLSLQTIRLSQLVPETPLLPHINMLVVLIAGGLMLVVLFSLVSFCIAIQSPDYVTLQLSFEKRLREVKKEILEETKKC